MDAVKVIRARALGFLRGETDPKWFEMTDEDRLLLMSDTEIQDLKDYTKIHTSVDFTHEGIMKCCVNLFSQYAISKWKGDFPGFQIQLRNYGAVYIYDISTFCKKAYIVICDNCYYLITDNLFISTGGTDTFLVNFQSDCGHEWDSPSMPPLHNDFKIVAIATALLRYDNIQCGSFSMRCSNDNVEITDIGQTLTVPARDFISGVMSIDYQAVLNLGYKAACRKVNLLNEFSDVVSDYKSRLKEGIPINAPTIFESVYAEYLNDKMFIFATLIDSKEILISVDSDTATVYKEYINATALKPHVLPTTCQTAPLHGDLVGLCAGDMDVLSVFYNILFRSKEISMDMVTSWLPTSRLV